MATRPPISVHKKTINGNDVTLIGNTNALSQYFGTLTPLTGGVGEIKTSSVKATTVNRFPGDVGFQRKAGTRKYSTEKSKGGPALPGRRFWVETFVGTGENRKKRVQQFNYLGAWKDLKALARDGILGTDSTLRNTSGRSVKIDILLNAPGGGD